MPRTKIFLVKTKKKKTKKKGRKAAKPLVSLSRQPVPSTAIVKLRYCQTISIDAGSGITNSRLYRANSMYDPDYSSTSTSQHQPLAYDQWSVFYDQYCVVGSKITVQPINTSATVPLQFGVALRQGQISAEVNPTILHEQGDSTWNYCGNMSYQGRCRPVTKKFSTKRFLGYKNPTNETSLKAAFTANPEKVAFFQVWCAAADSTANPPATIFQITIDFIAVLSAPKNLPQS